VSCADREQTSQGGKQAAEPPFDIWLDDFILLLKFEFVSRLINKSNQLPFEKLIGWR
jgi:hypothetical protein